MRLLSLNLARYGSFTDKNIVFDPSAKLHVVHGKNAAGKSCALAGITDLFFGIEAQSRFSFLHEPKNMCIGASIRSSDGQTLAFLRRKGNKNILATLDGQPLPDSALQPFLGGMNRNVFVNAFGLNSKQLREGAEEMLKSDGEVGVSLYAAATGLSGVMRLRGELEEEASKIFKPARSSEKRIFDQAAESYTRARLDIRNKSLRVEMLEGMRKEIERLGNNLQELTLRRTHNRSEHSRLVRLKTIAPQVHILDAELAQLTQFADLPELSSQSIERLRDVVGDAEESAKTLEVARETLERSQSAVQEFSEDHAALAHRATVYLLQTGIGKYEAANTDRARVAAEAEAKQKEIEQLAARIGIRTENLVESQPPDSALADVELLISQGNDLEREIQRIEKEVRDLGVKLDQLNARQNNDPQDDPIDWRDQLHALQSSRLSLERLVLLAGSTALTRKKLAERAARLTPAVTDLESHASLSMPTVETIEGFRRDFALLDNAHRQIANELNEISAEIKNGEKLLIDLAGDGLPVASSDLISSARLQRDTTWNQLRSVVLNDEPLLPKPSRPVAVALFEGQVSEADRLADAATRDADRVAEFNAKTTLISDKKMRLQEVDTNRISNENEIAKRKDDWLHVWAEVTDSPSTPAEMSSWIESSRGLLEQRDLLLADECEQLALDSEEVSIRIRLLALAASITVAIPEELATISIFSLLDTKIKRLENLWNESAARQGVASDTVTTLAKAKKDLAALTIRRDGWTAQWNVAVTSLGFAGGASTAAVEAAVKVWRLLPTRILARDSDLKRVKGMEKNIEDFRSEVTRLSRALMPSEVELEPVDQAAKLKTYMDRRVAVKLLLDNAVAQVSRDEEQFEKAKRLTESQSTAVKTRMAEMSLSGEPLVALGRLERAISVREKADAARLTLIAQSDGIVEEQLRQELQGFDAPAVIMKIQELSDRFPLQDEEINNVFATKSAATHALDNAELSSGAEMALQQMKGAELDLAGAVLDYLKLKLSAGLLDRVVEEHRAGQAGPLMSRASELFSHLTGGDFSRLTQEFDPDNDVPELVGERPAGKTVCIDGMSEGQRDQLYLALRLAYLEEYATGNEPVPFVGDDIFTTFDEESTKAGLLALADIGQHMQPILFTHHEFVVDLAEQTLGNQVDIVRL